MVISFHNYTARHQQADNFGRWEIAIENNLKFSARRDKRTAALRSRLITELNNLFIIMNDMNSDDNLSNEDVNHAISLVLAQSDSDG